MWQHLVFTVNLLLKNGVLNNTTGALEKRNSGLHMVTSSKVATPVWPQLSVDAMCGYIDAHTRAKSKCNDMVKP
jgi:hypothetical protein